MNGNTRPILSWRGRSISSSVRFSMEATKANMSSIPRPSHKGKVTALMSNPLLLVNMKQTETEETSKDSRWRAFISKLEAEQKSKGVAR